MRAGAFFISAPGHSLRSRVRRRVDRMTGKCIWRERDLFLGQICIDMGNRKLFRKMTFSISFLHLAPFSFSFLRTLLPFAQQGQDDNKDIFSKLLHFLLPSSSGERGIKAVPMCDTGARERRSREGASP